MMEVYRYRGDLGFALGGVYCVLDGYQFKRLLSSKARLACASQRTGDEYMADTAI